MRNELALISLKDVGQYITKAVYKLASKENGFCSKGKNHFVQAGGIGKRVGDSRSQKTVLGWPQIQLEERS